MITKYEKFNLLLCISLALSTVRCFVITSESSYHASPRRQMVCYATNDEKKSGGYKFGDLTRSLTKKATERVNELTGKETYEFGDLSRYLDERAKERITSVKGISKNETYKYQLGDLTKWADNLAKEKAAQYAGKQNATEYKVGDISMTVVKKVQSGEYDVNDVFLALRVLLAAGFAITPIARLIPLKGLLQLVNLGLKKDVGGRVLEVLASSLDSRVKDALAGQAKHVLGEVTKDRLEKSVMKFTGKDGYEFGDLTSSIMKQKDVIGKDPKQLLFSKDLVDKLSIWDQKFLLDKTK